MNKKINLFTLVFLIVAAIDSIRNFPSAALFGSSLIFFFLFSALIFLAPVSLLSAEFSSRYSDEGGIFHWIRHAFGEKIGFLAVWLQWINTMVWYPTILSFIAGTAAYLFDPALAQSRSFLIVVILLVFWGLTFINLKGLHISSRINTICSIIGTILPMFFLIFLGFSWLFQSNPLQIGFSYQEIIPSNRDLNLWSSLIAIMASFLGMELSGVHVNDILNPQKNFPKALGFAAFILLFTMLFGSLAIAFVIPREEIHLVDGIMQSFSYFFSVFHLDFLVRPISFLIIVGSIGGMINWLLSPAKGLLQATEYGFLPAYFQRTNENKVPYRILLTQAIFVTLICISIKYMPSINAFYWFFTELSTSLYMFMYVLMFLSALKLGRPEGSSFQIPKGLRTLSCGLGLFACGLTIFVGFFPPAEIEIDFFKYGCMIGLSTLILLMPVAFFIYQRKR